MTDAFIKRLHFNESGLVPAVIQDASSNRVLTLCYLNAEAIERTLRDGTVWVYRRSAGKLMKKGETSGHTQKVRSLHIDCEGKSLLVRVDQKTAACHAGYFSCYFETFDAARGWRTLENRVFDPEMIYPTARTKSKKKTA